MTVRKRGCLLRTPYPIYLFGPSDGLNFGLSVFVIVAETRGWWLCCGAAELFPFWDGHYYTSKLASERGSAEQGFVDVIVADIESVIVLV